MDLVELCAGSAALSMWWLGGAPPMAYQGSKRGYAAQIGAALGLRRGGGRSDRVTLVEIGPWAEFWVVVRDERQRLLERLAEWAARDPAELWHELKAAPVPTDQFERVAVWAVLQFWNYARKPVTADGKRWDQDGCAFMTQWHVSSRRVPYLARNIARVPPLDGIRVICGDSIREHHEGLRGDAAARRRAAGCRGLARCRSMCGGV